MSINAEWHRQNKLGKNAGLEKRIAWHIEHQKACGCREIPKSIKVEISKRKVQAN